MKRIFSFVFSLLLVASLSLTSFAANVSVITPEEKAVIDYVQKVADENNFPVSTNDITAMNNYFKTIDITADQKSDVISGIDGVVETIKADPSYNGNLKSLSVESKNTVVQKISKIVAIVGLKVSYDSNNSVLKFLSANNGDVVYQNELPIKQTGSSDLHIYILIGVALVGLLAVGSVLLVVFEKKQQRN